MANSGMIREGVVDLQEMYSEDGQEPPQNDIEVCSAILNSWDHRTDPGRVPNSGSACALVSEGWGDQRTKHADRVRIGNVCPLSHIDNPQNKSTGFLPPPLSLQRPL